MRARGAALIALLLVLVAVFWWMRRSPAPPAATAGVTTAAAPAKPKSPLGLRIFVHTGAPGSTAAMTARIFNHLSRQAALDRDAAAVNIPGRTVSAAPPAPAPVSLQFTDAEWLERLTFDAVTPDGRSTRITNLTMRKSPTGATSLDDKATLLLVFECPSSSLPAPGTSIVANYAAPEGAVRSNTHVMTASPTAALAIQVADARVSRVLGNIDRLDAAATSMLTTWPNAMEGPYYKGLVLEARGNRDAALASYRTALTLEARTPQPGEGSELIALIRALEKTPAAR